MAKIHGIPGEWARVKGTVTGLWPLFLGVFSIGFASALALSFPLTGLALAVASVVYVIVTLHFGLKHVERFFKGARGEEKVSGVLAKLPDTYHVFNDFDCRGAHVDHVVVGPCGVFSVETKCWSGRVTVEDGHVLVDGRLPSHSPLKQAVQEATWVRNALAKAGWSGVVTPVLVFASDTFAARRANLRGTVVMNSSELLSSYDSCRVVLSPDELERLVSIMEAL